MSDKPKFAFARVPERAVDDKRPGNAGFRVLAALCSYADKDGHCFPGLGTIGGRLGVTRQAVQRQMRRLKSLGYVNTEKRARPNGSGTTNRYLIIFEPTNESNEGGQRHVAGVQRHVAGGATSEVAGGATSEVAPLNRPLNKPSNNILPMPPPKGTSVSPADLFQRWWQHYPRKIAKGDAERAFKAALKVASFEDIFAGTRRYADHVRRNDTPKKFIKYPAGWLRTKRWLDDDEAAGRDDPDDCFKDGETADRF